MSYENEVKSRVVAKSNENGKDGEYSEGSTRHSDVELMSEHWGGSFK